MTFVQDQNTKAPVLNFSTTEHHQASFDSIERRYWRMSMSQLSINESTSNWKLGYNFLNDIYYSKINLYDNTIIFLSL